MKKHISVFLICSEKKFSSFAMILTSLYIGGLCIVGQVNGQTNHQMKKNLTKLTDEEIVRVISPRNRKESFEAAKEIMRRGDRMISLLIASKGNRQPFAWGSLGNSLSSEITYAPSGDNDWDEGRIVTVEVASLYLISALYHQNFEFAQSAYLRDGSEVEFNKHNTVERVNKAWASVATRLDKMKIEGIPLRKSGCAPLSASGLYF